MMLFPGMIAGLNDISEKIIGITKNQIIRDTLRQAFDNIEFNEPQIAAIKEAFTPSLLSYLPEEITECLTATFIDSPAQTLGMIKSAIAVGAEDIALTNLYDGQLCLRDIVYNYPLLLGDDMPEIIESTIETYETIISDAGNLYDRINAVQRNPAKPNKDRNYYDGRDHLKPLPEDFLSLTPAAPDAAPEP